MANGISVPSELVTGIFQSMFGQGYVNSIAIGILALLTGYIFLSYRFVIRGKDNPTWKKIKQTDKLIISFFTGFAFLLLGAESLTIFNQILKITNVFQVLNSLELNLEYALYLSILLYAGFLLYPKSFNIKINVFEQIENYFKSFIKIFFILFSIMFLLTITLVGFIAFAFFIWLYINNFEKKKIKSFFKKIKTRNNH